MSGTGRRGDLDDDDDFFGPGAASEPSDCKYIHGVILALTYRGASV